MSWNESTIKERKRLLGEAGISLTNYAWRTWSVLPAWVRRDIDFVLTREKRGQTKSSTVKIISIERKQKCHLTETETNQKHQLQESPAHSHRPQQNRLL